LRFRDAAGRWATLRFHEADIAVDKEGRKLRLGAATRLEHAAEFAEKCLNLGKGWHALAKRLPIVIAQLDSSAVPIYANDLAQSLFSNSAAMSDWRATGGALEPSHLGKIALQALSESLSQGHTVSRLIRHGDADIWAALHCVPANELAHEHVLLVGHLFRPGVPDTQRDLRPGLSELLLAAVSDPVIVADAVTGQLLDANPAATVAYGWPREKLLQLRWDDLIADAGEPTLTQRTPPEPGVSLGRHRRRGGASFPVEARENTLLLKGRSIVISTIRDITERVTAEQQQSELEARLQQAQKLESLGVMAGGIAHDFNNLLSGILGSIDLVNAELPQHQSDLKQSLSLARECAERAAVLCDQLLAYSGRGRFVIKPISLNTLVEELRPLLEMSLVNKPCLEFEFDPDLPLIEIDVAQVRQVVLNLVMNAAEATRAGSGHVTVRSHLVDVQREDLARYLMGDQLTAGKYVALEVIDDGCGMDHSTMTRIFEPFFTTKFAGRGLGLSALMGIVRGHRGAIQVMSDAGKGSLFRVLFPTQRRRLSDAVHTPVLDWHGCGCVLFADDEMPVRNIARRILERLGFQVVLAQSGRGAVDEFGRRPDAFSLVILDLTMPEMTGEEALREIRLLRPQVPIVLTSGYGEEEVLERLAHVRVDAFLKKPFRMDDFTGVVQSVLDRRSVSGIDFKSKEHPGIRISEHNRAQGGR
jgi:PAS domain S-box-containing protein